MKRATRLAALAWAAGAFACLALLAALSCAVNPVSGQQELALMSEQEEVALGRRHFPHTLQINNGLPGDDPELQEYVNQVGQRLAAQSHRPRMPWEFKVVNQGRINAFALVGGKIMITRGLITQLKSEDELASVLAHEVGHIAARHTVAQYTNKVLINVALLGVSVALHDSKYGELGNLAAGMAANLLLLGYSRDQERQADLLGHEYMTKDGYNPQGTVEVFTLFLARQKQEPGLVEAMLSSHPLTSERLEEARRRVAEAPPGLVGQPLKVEAFQRALARQLDRRPAYQAMARGDRLVRQDHLSQAAEQYQQAIDLFPREGLFHSRLAMTRLRLKQAPAALEAARAGAILSPQLFQSQFVEGLAHIGNHDYHQALASLERADGLLPEHLGSRYLMARCYEKLGNRGQAIKLYRQVAKAGQGKLSRQARQRLAALKEG